MAIILLLFLKFDGDVLYALDHEEAERPGEAQDDHQQQLPHQHEVTAVEERRCCRNRLTVESCFIVISPNNCLCIC